MKDNKTVKGNGIIKHLKNHIFLPGTQVLGTQLGSVGCSGTSWIYCLACNICALGRRISTQLGSVDRVDSIDTVFIIDL